MLNYIYTNIGGKPMAEIKYEVTERLGALSEPVNGYAKELNMVSWNDHTPVFDLRPWNTAHDRMSKGVTFNKAEAKALRDILNGLNLDD